ncbi:MAG: copper amine oxidase N-terminal domain-containing protein [Armatimonadetes bacterium]|nr:copper amine oxidase N-terminal domain-containing protein [Armatimonadota bacterium]
MRRFALVLIAILSIVAAPGVNGAQEPIRVLVDGDPVSFDVVPLERQGRVLVPLRGVFERLGACVEYDAGLRTIVAVRGQTIVQLGLGRCEVTIDGRPSTLDVPAVSVGGRTMVPLRPVSEALGASVQWEADTRTVSIATGGAAATPLPGAGQQTIAGILLSVNASQSRLTLQQPNGPVTISVTPDTTILRTNLENNEGGRRGSPSCGPATRFRRPST